LVEIHDDSALVSWEQVAALFEQVGWVPRSPDQLRVAFERSVARGFAFHDGQLVGVARAVGDGIYYATLVDVVVAPSFQRSGIGSALVRFVQSRTSCSFLLTLTASADVQPFYRRLGWLPQATAMLFPRSPEQAALNCSREP
jgi:GNAT superfamily N-acetyltransferase